MSSTPKQIEIAEYIVARLAQLGSTPIFGVPGDFNLAFLDYIEKHPQLYWVGNANELNASYAADGYSRVTKKLAVLITTQGVGELSAINGIAGCMAERIPVLHIVGVASTKLQAKHAILHHTLGDGRFSVFTAISREVTAAQAYLTTAESAAHEIDRVLSVALTQCRPTYLTLPTDLVQAKVNADRLEKPLPAPAAAPRKGPLPAPSDAEAYVVEEITKRFEAAKDPIVLVDACTQRFGVEGDVQDLVEKTGIRFYVTPMGKGALNESHPNYGGVYMGEVSIPEIKDLVEASDLIMNVGAIKSDFNTGSWSGRILQERVVEFHSDFTQIGYAHFPDVTFKTLLPRLAERLAKIAANRPKPEEWHKKKEVKQANEARIDVGTAKPEHKEGEAITHEYFWPRVGKFFKENDIIITETGTSEFGILDVTFPEGAKSLSQVLWGSIGWAGGSVLGAALGSREQKRRTILFIGDGSLQLTVQEIATLVRHQLTPILFVISNDGYEIERKIHGETAKYNDVSHIDHQLLLDTFSPPAHSYQPKPPHKSYAARNKAELEDLLNNSEIAKADQLQLIEVFMPRGDAPRALKLQAEMSARANAA